MFEEAKRRIMNLDSCVEVNTSRITACENEIYKINCERYTDTISTIECNIIELTNRIDQLTYEVKVL